jgi:hypothetical protein
MARLYICFLFKKVRGRAEENRASVWWYSATDDSMVARSDQRSPWPMLAENDIL